MDQRERLINQVNEAMDDRAAQEMIDAGRAKMVDEAKRHSVMNMREGWKW